MFLLMTCPIGIMASIPEQETNPKSKNVFSLSIQSVDEKISLKGNIVDSTGEPLIGVNVLVKGASSGTVTDIDGNFSLAVEKGAVIEISYIGYVTQNLTINDATPLKIVMKEDSEQLEEVVVTALGIKRATKALSYNVQEVKGDELTAVKDANFMNSLAGKVAGVQINSSATGAGGAARVVMRGAKSITKDNNALYVIDGVPMFNVSFGASEGQFATQAGSDGVADINPDDIESISMLTGPSAAALYGNSAANGVVLINTKKGKSERTSLSVSNSTTFSTPYIMPDMQNTYGNKTGEFASWGDKTALRYDPKKFFNTGANVINAITFSTGTDKNQTYASASTTHSTGILPNNKYSRYNFSIRNTANFLNDRLKVDLGASYIIQNDKNMTAQGQYFNPIPALYLFPRGENFDAVRLFERYNEARGINIQYWPYSHQGISLQNPYWIMKRMNRVTEKQRYMLNGSLTYKFVEGIDITGRVKVDNSHYRLTQERYASTLGTFAGPNGFYSDQTRTDRSIYADVMLNINKRIDDFTVNANIGASIRDLQYEQAGGEGDLAGIANFFTLANLNYTSNYKPKQFGYHDQSQGIFANLELGWRSMLYLTLTGRNDWESQLAFTNHSSFFYPSVGLSAVLTEMFKLPEFISYAKVRASYTSVASSFERFLSNPGFEFSEQSHQWGTSSTRPATDLKPEKTKSWELGLNTKLWNDFNFDFTFYKSNTYNQTFTISQSPSSGFSSAIVQSGNVSNYGIEMGLGYSHKFGDLEWTSNYTFTLNRNKIKKLIEAIDPETGKQLVKDELRVAELGATGYAPVIILRKDGGMGDIYVEKHLATDCNGDIKVDSQTGKVSIAEYDEPRKVGSLYAKCNMGFNNSFTYKGFNLGFTLAARIGGLVVSNTQGILDYFGVSQATADAREAGGVWINNGYVDAQSYYQTVGSSSGGIGEYYLYSATNVRLQELSLNYTFPKKWFNNKVGITAGIIGKNLWMIYCKAPFDPELTPSTTSNFYQGVDYFMQPSTRNIGFNLKFQF